MAAAGFGVADLCHQGDRRARHRVEQPTCLIHDRVGLAFGQAEHERQVGGRGDRVRDGVRLVGAQRRRLTEDSERDEAVATVGGEFGHLVAQRVEIDVEVVVERGGQNAPKAVGQ